MWLPITSSRHAKSWYSTFHNVTAMVSAGIFSLPYVMSQLGWAPNIVLNIMSWVITLYTLWQMVKMHEMIPSKCLDLYHELGQEAFGKKLGLWIVVPQQLMNSPKPFLACGIPNLSLDDLILDADAACAELDANGRFRLEGKLVPSKSRQQV